MKNIKVAPKWKTRIDGLLRAFAIQGFFALLFFVGTLLDPLIGLGIAAIYFLFVGTLSIYFCQLNRMGRGKE